MDKIAFFLMRAGMGVNFLFHAVNRFYYGPKGFSAWMVTAFKDTFFPPGIVHGFSQVLPYVEGILGVLLLVGLRTRAMLVAGSLVIIGLMIGSCMINQWDWVTFQLIYLICFYFLMKDIQADSNSIDLLLSKK